MITSNLIGQLKIQDLFHLATISTNRSFDGYDSNSNIGFGIAINHIVFPTNRINLITGLEYNRTKQYYNSLHISHYYYSSDVYFKFNSISTPIGARFNIDRKNLISIETGLYFAFLFHGTEQGTLHMDQIDPETNMVTGVKISDYSHEVRASDVIGIYSSINIQIPIKNKWIIISPEYKLGLNSLGSTVDYIRSRYVRLKIGYRFR